MCEFVEEIIRSRSGSLKIKSSTEEIFDAFGVKAIMEPKSSFQPYNTMNRNDDNKSTPPKQYKIIFDGDIIVGCLDAVKYFAIRNGMSESDILSVIDTFGKD